MAEKDNDRIVVTSALPYVNGPIHVGSLMEYIQTDIFVRFLKLQGKNAIYCCAGDTHGTPIEVNAQKEGKSPEEFVEYWTKEQAEAFDIYNIDFDSYHSTDSPENKEFVLKLYERLKEEDMLYEKEMKLAYCETDERFLPDRYVKGTCPECGAEDQYGDQCEVCGQTYTTTDVEDAECVICGNKPVTKKSNHKFFKLSEMEDELREYIEDNENLQQEVKNQITSWIDGGLDDWCITRDPPYYGFEVPDMEDKYFYVWLDAPVGYMSSLANYLGSVDKAEEEWNNSEIIHFIGKDIVYFHLLFWPAVLMKTGMNLPSNVFVHGFLNIDDEKMSKSRGTFLTAKDMAEIVEPELLRFYYAASLNNKVVDINLDTENFVERVNNELVSNIANFIYRTLSFLDKYFDRKLGSTTDKDFYGILNRRMDNVIEHYEDYNLRKAMQMILHISSEGNKYFQEKRPWITARTNKTECIEVLTTCANLAKNLAILIKPIMPNFAAEVEKQLGLSDLDFDDLGFDWTDAEIGEPKHIYEKIEDIELEQDESNFGLLNLKVGQILEVKDHPDADKLYILKVDMGDDERQLVAGLKEHYEKDELEEKKVIVVSNLEPADLRGEKSEGMLLAAEGLDEEEEKAVGILFVQESPVGDQVKITGVEPNQEQITFDQFKEVDITTEEGRVHHQENMLRTSREYVKVERVQEGKVK